jgi:hypothetical protein
MTASITVQAAATPTNTATNTATPTPSGSLVINEVDYDQPSTDTAEFIELKNVSGATINLATVTVELINGAGCCTPYATFNLPNVNLAPGAYYVVCANSSITPNCDLDVTPDTNLIQNGAPDAIGLRIGGTLVDAVSYEGDTGAPYTEGSGAGLSDDGLVSGSGISRIPDGADTNMNNVDLSPRCITPGAANTTDTCGAFSPTASPSPTFTLTASPTPTSTLTPTSTPTSTVTPTSTPTATPMPFSGIYNVGAGQQFTSLTMPGGIFEALDYAGTLSGDVTINITSDLMGENGEIALNELSGGFNILIKPSGGARTITGSSAVGIIRLNAADRVTIDGSTTGGSVSGVVGGDPSLRQLTIQNNDASTASGVIILDAGSNGAQNNTLKNLNIRGSSPDQTGYLISIAGATGGSHGTDNSFDTIENCSLRSAIIGIWLSGFGATGNTSNTITENDLTGTGSERIRRAAISIGSQFQPVVSLNSIGGIDDSTTGEDALGIGIGVLGFGAGSSGVLNVSNGEIYRNRINGVRHTNQQSAGGIVLLCSGCEVYNNMVSGVVSNASLSRIVTGIYAASSSEAQINYNSVSMTGDRGAGASQGGSFALAMGNGLNMLVYSNILYTTQTASSDPTAHSYAIGTQVGGFPSSIQYDYNDYWSTGANDGGFRLGSLGSGGGIDYPDLASWQTATSRDTNSIEADPLFISPVNDPHIQYASPARNMAGGTFHADDIDGDVRPQETALEIGADEVFGPTPTSTGTPTGTATNTPTPGGATPSISGVITYGNAIGNPPPPRLVRNVTVQSTAGSPAVGPVITGTPGAYTLTGFGATSYTIKPSKPGGANTAITSADAARTAQGVAGSVPFVSQNQRFAADTSGNGGPNPVTSNDAALIARFAAGLTGFGRTGTWFFFVTGAPSPMPTAPATYNDSRSYASVTTALTGQDYVAILVGEVTGNYNPANNARPAIGPESITSVELPQVAVNAGKEIVIPVRVQGAVDKIITSYEFDLRYDPSVIQPWSDPVDIAKTASRGLSFAVNAHEPGLLRVVMYGAYPIDRDGVLMNLRFTAVGKPGSISPLTFEQIMFNEGDPAVTVSDGRIELF